MGASEPARTLTILWTGRLPLAWIHETHAHHDPSRSCFSQHSRCPIAPPASSTSGGHHGGCPPTTPVSEDTFGYGKPACTPDAWTWTRVTTLTCLRKPRIRSAPTWPSGPGRQAGLVRTHSGPNPPGRRPRPRIAAARSARRRTASAGRPGNPRRGWAEPEELLSAAAALTGFRIARPGQASMTSSLSPGSRSAESLQVPLSHNQARAVPGSSLMAPVLSRFRGPCCQTPQSGSRRS
jgi:hypothetical protein